MNTHQGIIRKVCRLYCEHEEDQRDLFQEILIQLWKAYPSFRGQAKLTTWMYRVALNTAISHYRKNRRLPVRTEISEHIFQLADFPSHEQEERMQALYQSI